MKLVVSHFILVNKQIFNMKVDVELRKKIFLWYEFYFQEKLLGQNQWKDYSGPMGPPPGHVPAPHHNYGYDAFEADDSKMGWHNHQPSSRQSYERYARGSNTHSLPRGAHVPQHQPSAYPMGYSSYDRRSGGHSGHTMSSRPSAGSEYPPPDHYFMPSQRKYSGEILRVYVDYNKWDVSLSDLIDTIHPWLY